MQDVNVSRPSTTVAVISLHGEHDVFTDERFEELGSEPTVLQGWRSNRWNHDAARRSSSRRRIW